MEKFSDLAKIMWLRRGRSEVRWVMGNDSTLNDYYLAHVIPTVVRISLLYGFLNRLFFNEYSLTIEFIHNS